MECIGRFGGEAEVLGESQTADGGISRVWVRVSEISELLANITSDRPALIQTVAYMEQVYVCVEDTQRCQVPPML